MVGHTFSFRLWFTLVVVGVMLVPEGKSSPAASRHHDQGTRLHPRCWWQSRQCRHWCGPCRLRRSLGQLLPAPVRGRRFVQVLSGLDSTCCSTFTSCFGDVV